jgi:glycosyltransferase XagB
VTSWLVALFLATQGVYLASMLTVLYLLALPVDYVDVSEGDELDESELPKILLLYPVLNELEDTMRSTFVGLGQMDYPESGFRVVAIPNSDDVTTLESLERLAGEFPFLRVLPVPSTDDPSWNVVFDAWGSNEKAYWWHHGKRAGERALPAKKTRQLVYAFYTLVERYGPDWLLDYIDADSIPPTDHFKAAAAGIRRFDVLQATNVAGNLLDSYAASLHAMDHMCWDGAIYPHLSSGGKQPFWVLGKGLFFKARDLVECGGFNPWLTIEDPEVGMRLWINGKRLGIIAAPLIEEVPITFSRGITQRKRWIAGFLQSLHSPLKAMGYTLRQRIRARINVVPCLSLLINPIGFATSIWAFSVWALGDSPIPAWSLYLTVPVIGLQTGLLIYLTHNVWRRTHLVLARRRSRVRYLLRVSPPFLYAYWLLWSIPIMIGIQMFARDRGLTWERTEKIDANHELVRTRHTTLDHVGAGNA